MRVVGAPTMPGDVKQINCVCGKVVKGDDDDELWEKAQEHLERTTRPWSARCPATDILAQAEER